MSSKSIYSKCRACSCELIKSLITWIFFPLAMIHFFTTSRIIMHSWKAGSARAPQLQNQYFSSEFNLDPIKVPTYVFPPAQFYSLKQTNKQTTSNNSTENPCRTSPLLSAELSGVLNNLPAVTFRRTTQAPNLILTTNHFNLIMYLRGKHSSNGCYDADNTEKFELSIA